MEHDRVADTQAIHALNADFAHHLDHGDVERLLELFTPGARYSNGSRVSVGLAEIEVFLRNRTAGGVRTTRHFYSGLRVTFSGADKADATSVWMSFARNAAPPVDGTAPFLVADFIDAYVRLDDGRWRIEARDIRPVFRDPNGQPPSSRPSPVP